MSRCDSVSASAWARKNHANSLVNFPPTQQQIGFYRGKLQNKSIFWRSIHFNRGKINYKIKRWVLLIYVFISKFRWIKLVFFPHFTWFHVCRTRSLFTVVCASGMGWWYTFNNQTNLWKLKIVWNGKYRLRTGPRSM